MGRTYSQRGTNDEEDQFHRRRREESSSSEDERTGDDRKRRKKVSRKHQRKQHDRKKNRRQEHSESEEDSVESTSKHRRHKKHKKNKDRKHPRKSRRDREAAVETVDSFDRNYRFADALHKLLDEHPALSTDLPLMLIRMANGSSFDLSQMLDVGARQGLARVFETLEPFGVEQHGTSWTWKAPAGGTSKNNELLLVKISRLLLDQIGLTIEAVEAYGKEAPEANQNEALLDLAQTSEIFPIQHEALTLIDRFVHMDVTLPNQLGELCLMILGGDSVALDELPDNNLREGLEKLFRSAGLIKSQMEIEEGNDSEREGATAFGYGLPESNDEHARLNLGSILASCKQRVDSIKSKNQKRTIRGPLPEHMAEEYAVYAVNHDSDDDRGPLPAGPQNSRKGLSNEVVRDMASQRLQQLKGLTSDLASDVVVLGEREEWMINPGEHDLLQGIKSGVLKTRSFQNRKAPSSAIPEAPVNPSLQAEVDAIMKVHREARGPTLMEQHRANIGTKNAEKDKTSNASFEWSREKDLDSGRRIDKEALRLLMGGASGGLSDKFQGGFNKE